MCGSSGFLVSRCGVWLELQTGWLRTMLIKVVHSSPIYTFLCSEALAVAYAPVWRQE